MNPDSLYGRAAQVAQEILSARLVDRVRSYQVNAARVELFGSLGQRLQSNRWRTSPVALSAEAVEAGIRFERLSELLSTLRALQRLGLFSDLRNPPTGLATTPMRPAQLEHIEWVGARLEDVLAMADAMAAPEAPGLTVASRPIRPGVVAAEHAELRNAERNFEEALDRLRSLGFEPAREGYARMCVSHVGLSLATQRALLDAVDVGLFGVTKDAEVSGRVDVSGLKGTFEQAKAMAAADVPQAIRVVVDVADGEVFAVSADCEVEAVVLDRHGASQNSASVEIDGEMVNASRVSDGGENPRLCDLVFTGLQDMDSNEMGMKP